MKPADRLTVLLTTEGTYPYSGGGVSTWCNSLLAHTPEVRYTLLPIMMNPHIGIKFDLPRNVSRVMNVPLWGIEEPAEFLSDIPFGRVYSRKRITTERVIEERFLPLIDVFLNQVNAAGSDPAVFGESLAALADYFQEFDYNTSFKARSTWELFREKMNRVSRELLDGSFMAERGLPSLFDLTESLRWLYRFMIVLNIRVPRTRVTHSTAAAFCGIPCIISKVRYATPMVLTEHGVYLREQNLFLSRFRYLLFSKRFLLNLITAVSRANYFFADVISPVCHYNTRWEMAHGTPRRKIQVIYNGVDPDRFVPGERSSSAPHVIATARIDPLKDIETFLRMAALVRNDHPSCRFTIFGAVADRSYYEKCLSLRESLGLTDAVRMGSATSDVVNAYIDSDVVALTSISEAFPFSVVEAMSCGKAVVASDVGGVREALEGSGILVKPRDPAGFASAVSSLLSDEVARRQLGMKARSRVLEDFTLERSVSQYLELYRSMDGERAA